LKIPLSTFNDKTISSPRYARIISLPAIKISVERKASSRSIINNQRQRVFADGTIIAGALNNYYKHNNIYPEELKELMPKYINSIPKIKMTYDNGDFSYYSQYGGKSYFLGFEAYYFDGTGWTTVE
jgi:hypothetical protein